MRSAGLDLNKLIAENIFGFKVSKKDVLRFSEDGMSGDWVEKAWRIEFHIMELNGEYLEMPWFKNKKPGDFGEADLPDYSGDLIQAWKVVEKLGQNGTQWRFSNKAFSNKYWWAYTEDTVAQGSTLAEAICLAALQHKEEQRG